MLLVLLLRRLRRLLLLLYVRTQESPIVHFIRIPHHFVEQFFVLVCNLWFRLVANLQVVDAKPGADAVGCRVGQVFGDCRWIEMIESDQISDISNVHSHIPLLLVRRRAGSLGKAFPW